MTPTFTISDTEMLILALSSHERLLVSCQLSIISNIPKIREAISSGSSDCSASCFLYYLH